MAVVKGKRISVDMTFCFGLLWDASVVLVTVNDSESISKPSDVATHLPNSVRSG